MYDNSRVPSYTSVSSRPCRLQVSRWSLDVPAQSLHSPKTTTMSSSFYFPQATGQKQILTPNYVNYYSPSTSTSSNHYERPKSTIVCDSMSNHQSTFHVNDLRQRFETKPVVGIVKPMVHQRSCNDLNNGNHQQKSLEMINMTGSFYQNSARSSVTSSMPSPCPSTSSVLYRTRTTSSQSNFNGAPPIAPRRYSSINPNHNKSISSRRSSRTTSTSSSIVASNEISSRNSSDEQEQLDEDTIIFDVKRLEMFYGSVGTLVKASHSLARLYITTTRQLANFEDWSCQKIGVPIWIYNTGANLKRARQVRLMLVNHESCYGLWSSLISDQAEVRLPKDNYITCWLPESNMLVVFKFERDDACRLFFRQYYEILQYEKRMNLANPPPLPADNTQIDIQKKNNPTANNKEVPRRYSRLKTIINKSEKEEAQQQFEMRRCRSLSKIRTVKKSDISGPINFEHVNHIGSGNGKQSRPLSRTGTLRSLHSSMSNLLNNNNNVTNDDRTSKTNKNPGSTLFEPKTTAV